MNSSFKRGFTLIELLVVIAIIAILAAILFPVFAQAKAAAKQTAALSDTKQLALAVQMYENDYDDNFPLGTEWSSSPSGMQLGWSSANLWFSTWGWQVAPYVKSAGLFEDPTTAAAPLTAAQQGAAINYDSLYTDFGYNYTFLSPYQGPSSSFHPTSVSSTTGNSLSNTVMLSSKWAYSDKTYSAGLLWGTGFPTSSGLGGTLTGAQGMLADAGSESPDCDWISYWCLTDWGSGGFFDDATPADQHVYPTIEGGRKTGGNAYRVSNHVTVAWADGHAKTISPQGLAQGTSFSLTAAAGQPGSAGYIDVTKAGSYLWTLSKDCSDFPGGETDPDTSKPACSQ